MLCSAWVTVFSWWRFLANKKAASSSPSRRAVAAARCSGGLRSAHAARCPPIRLDPVATAKLTRSVTTASLCAPTGKFLTSSAMRRARLLRRRAVAVTSPPYRGRDLVTVARSCATASTASLVWARDVRDVSQALRQALRSAGPAHPRGLQGLLAHPEAPPGQGCTATSPP